MSTKQPETQMLIESAAARTTQTAYSSRRQLERAPAMPRVRWSPGLLFCLSVLAALSFSLVRAVEGLSPLVRVPENLIDRRLLPTRLTGGFAYRPYEPTIDGVESGLGTDDIFRTAEAPTRGDGDPASLTERAYRLLGDPDGGKKLPLAFSLLETAAAQAPGSAAALSNLAAVSYSLGLHQGKALGVLLALSSADRALAIDPWLPEAQFNRALCLEYFGLWTDAAIAWEKVKRQEPGTGWADEAGTHLRSFASLAKANDFAAALPAVLATGDPEALFNFVKSTDAAARYYLENILLPAWGDSGLHGRRQSAARQLAIAEAIAAALARGGDLLYAESVGALRRAEQRGDESALAALAAGYREFAAGVADLGAGSHEAARDWFIRSRDSLERGGSPFAWRASFKIAICDQALQDYEPALDGFRSLVREAEARSYLSLLAESLRMQGLIENDRNGFEASDAAYRRAAEIFKTLREPSSEDGALNLLAERRAMTGDPEQAIEDLVLRLQHTRTNPSLGGRQQIYTVATSVTTLAGHPEVALYFATEALKHAQAQGAPGTLEESYRWRARIQHQLGHDEEAWQDLGQAQLWLAKIKDPKTHQHFQLELKVTASELILATDPRTAVAELEQAIAAYPKDGHQATKLSSLLALGRARAIAGDEPGASQAINEGLELYEKIRQELGLGERNAFYQSKASAFAEIVDLELRQRHEDRAFDRAEQARDRTLLEVIEQKRPDEGAAGDVALLPVDALRSELPADVAIVEFAEHGGTGGRLSAWVLTREGLHWVELTRDLPALSGELDRFLHQIHLEVPEASLRQAGGSLYRRLIAPLEQYLPANGRLVIVPDGSLGSLPFSALFDAASHHYLVERWAVAYAPSANLYVQALRRDRSLAGSARPSALVIAPDFDEGEFSELQPLAGARRESAEIAKLYQHPDPLLGAAATSASFLETAGDHEIVHFAGHAVANAHAPEKSYLLFTPEPGDPAHGALSAAKIYERSFTRTRLLVLGSCSTAGGVFEHGSGTGSLARAFLAADVPGVVATLWNVNDSASSELLVAFHRQLLKRREASRALQAAQIELIHATGVPRTTQVWSAFELIGEASLERE